MERSHACVGSVPVLLVELEFSWPLSLIDNIVVNVI